MKKIIRSYFEWSKLSLKTSLNTGSLPDFYIIGAQKSGTSSLYDCLCHHPGIIHRLQKEIHFFNNPTNRQRGLAFYQAHFSSRSYRGQLSGKLGYRPLEGEATPFMVHPWIPKWVFQVTPKAKLIMIVRNPIDRALSHYYHNKRRNREVLSFEDAVGMEEQRINQDWDQLLKDPNHPAQNFLSFSYKKRGLYFEQLERWLQYFPREQIHIVSFDHFIQDQAKVAAQIFKFLELPNFELASTAKTNTGRYNHTLSQDVKQGLTAYFSPDNQRFFEAIKEDAPWF